MCARTQIARKVQRSESLKVTLLLIAGLAAAAAACPRPAAADAEGGYDSLYRSEHISSALRSPARCSRRVPAPPYWYYEQTVRAGVHRARPRSFGSLSSANAGIYYPT